MDVAISAIGAGDPAGAHESMGPYLEAKAEADEALQGSGLAFTVVRPGRLTDANATGHVAAGPVERGDIPRADVALALVAVLDTATTVGRTFNVVSGQDPVYRAVAAL